MRFVLKSLAKVQNTSIKNVYKEFTTKDTPKEHDQTASGTAQGQPLQIQLRRHPEDAAGQALCVQPGDRQPAHGAPATDYTADTAAATEKR